MTVLRQPVCSMYPALTSVREVAGFGHSLRAQSGHPAPLDSAAGLSGETVLQCAGHACLDHLLRNGPAGLAGDAEGIHQMRVAVRRWRSTLSALSRFLPPAQRYWAANELHWLNHALAEARNLDVFASALLAPARAALPAASEFERLAMAVERRRQIAHTMAGSAIGSVRYDASVRALMNWLDSCGWRTGGDAEALSQPIDDLAPAVLTRRHRQVKKRAKSFARQSEEQRHEFRIVLKKLRYAAELLGGRYDPARTIPFVRRLKWLQDNLGDVNDVRVGREIVMSLVDPGAPNTGIGHAGRRLIAWHTRRLSGKEPKLKRRVQQLLATEPFWL